MTDERERFDIDRAQLGARRRALARGAPIGIQIVGYGRFTSYPFGRPELETPIADPPPTLLEITAEGERRAPFNGECKMPQWWTGAGGLLCRR